MRSAAFPDTTVQTCIVHLVRHSLNFCGWKDRKNVAKNLKRIYQAADDVRAEKALAAGLGNSPPKAYALFHTGSTPHIRLSGSRRTAASNGEVRRL